jgi:hypothetical protein
VRAFLIATISAIAGGFLGSALLANWRISIGAMIIAGGIVFLLVGLRQLLDQYEPPHAPDANMLALPASPTSAALKVLFPIVLTPFGIAAVIVLLALSTESGRTAIIVGIVVVVMLLNLIAMLFARRILVGVTIVVLRCRGARDGDYRVTGKESGGRVSKPLYSVPAYPEPRRNAPSRRAARKPEEPFFKGKTSHGRTKRSEKFISRPTAIIIKNFRSGARPNGGTHGREHETRLRAHVPCP